MSNECFYCHDTGYIHTENDIPDQMCPNCEIGQAVIKGYNAARDIGIKACDTLEEAKNQRIKELENEKNELANCIEKINDKCVAIRRRNEKRITELDRLRASIHVSLIVASAAVVKGGEVTEELLTELIDELSPKG